jgi:hypothetical protein
VEKFPHSDLKVISISHRHSDIRLLGVV